MKTPDIILAITAIFSALMAGLFFSYSCSVTPGLAKLPDTEYIKAMQSINREIQNPVFFTVFFGVLLLLPLSTFLNYNQLFATRFWLLLFATVIYFGGVLGATILGNVPLNNALERFNPVNVPAETIRYQRLLFESNWNKLNTIRTISSITTIVLVIVACIYTNKPAIISR